MRTGLILYIALAGALSAQAPPAAIENTGKPMQLPFQCTEDDLHAFGLTCPPQQPCLVYLELVGIEPVGKKLFASGNLHTESATLFSILLASDDDGKTWREPFERVRQAGLDQIQFLDFENGWISGQTLSPLPRDPFLLITHDGGSTWRSRPVFEDGGVATIERFTFDSKTHGWLWLDRSAAGDLKDRFEMLESMTGGESWVTRETSSRPLKKPDRHSPGGYRLRADAATHSYRIERNEGPRWVPLASFSIRAGECREPEVTLPAEPPPVSEQPPEKP